MAERKFWIDFAVITWALLCNSEAFATLTYMINQ